MGSEWCVVPVRGWLRSPAVIESATPMGSTASLSAHHCSRPMASVLPGTAGLEEADLSVAAGGAKRNPRYAHTSQRKPRRGVYAACRSGHSDLFEADIITLHPTSGCAALHPRLLIAGPLRGRHASLPPARHRSRTHPLPPIFTPVDGRNIGTAPLFLR